jgi:hypothetical protein
MGRPTALFYFYIRNEDPLLLARDLLCFFNTDFLQAKSAEIRIPGDRVEKLKRSVDGDLFVKDGLPTELLPGERLVEESGLTTLDKADEFLTIPRDLSQITGCLRAYSEEVNRQSEKQEMICPSVYWTFWGLCKVAVGFAGSEPIHGYFLRQRLYGGHVFEPVLRISSDLIQRPQPEFIFRFSIHSFIWSRYLPEFDGPAQNWMRKPHVELELENARLLAETVSNYVRRYPNAEFEWEMEQEHTPDITGFLPSEFEARLGPPNNPKRLKDLAIK